MAQARPRLADHEVLRLLGSGGMARVFLVRHRTLGTLRAVKVLREGLPRFGDRLRVEGELLATLDHPNVVRVHEVARTLDGEVALIMDHVRGPTLADLVGSGIALTPAEVDLLARGLLAGVAAAHARGWVHRDLKPANVLLEVTADSVVPKVVDFGLVKVLDPDGTADAGSTTRLGFGTRRYMSLEQLSGAPADRRMDVFALGAVLFELVDRAPAFPTTARWEEAIRAGVGPSLSRPGPPGWARAIGAALGLRERRPEDAAALTALWVDGSDEPGAIRPETVQAAAWLGSHVTAEQLAEGDLDPEQLDHLAVCARCRLAPTPPTPPTSALGTDPSRAANRDLPAERDPFVGRTEERRTLDERLRSGARLVSVLGPGGIGKTRLVVRYARESHEDGPIWFCDLSTARDVDGVVTTVARTLGVPLGPLDPVAQLGHALAARGRCLMVLDNLEQAADAVEPTVGTWLDRAPEARFVVTSRHRLNLRGESVVMVGPLDRADAVALFELRFAAANGGRSADPGDRDAVEALVELLDDLPLAIELAAARSRILSVRELLVRMADRFRLLAVPRGSDRRQTLRATLDWSWDLLPAPEAAALAQLSVFAGSFSLASAEEVVASEAWVPDLVQTLVDRSLVAATADARFELSMSVRAYAAEKAREAGVGAEAAGRMGRHFAAVGDQALAVLDGVGGVARRHELVRELGNLVAACRGAVERGDAEVAVATLRAGWAVLELAGPWALGADLATSVLGLAGLGDRQRVDAGLVAMVAETLLGRLAAARDHAERAATDARAAGDPDRESRVRGRTAQLLLLLDRVDEAEAQYREALRRATDRRWEAHLLGALANLEAGRGREPEARGLHEQALALHRAHGNRRMEGVVLGNLGLLLQDQGRTAEARDHLNEALRIHRDVGERRAEAVVLAGLASVELAEGHPDRARPLLEASLAIHRRIGNRPREAAVLGHLAAVALETGRADEAEAYARSAAGVAAELGDDRARAAALQIRADADLALGRPREAVAALSEALDLAGPTHRPERLHHLGRAHRAAGDVDAACAVWEAGAHEAQALGLVDLEAEIRRSLLETRKDR